MIEKWCESVDKVGAFLIKLLKAFDYLPYEFLINKLYAYVFDLKSLNLIYNTNILIQ